MGTDSNGERDLTAGQRLYRWLIDGGSSVVVLYFLAAGLALGSIGSFMLGVGRGGTATDIQLVMVLAAAAILLYLAIASAGYDE